MGCLDVVATVVHVVVAGQVVPADQVVLVAAVALKVVVVAVVGAAEKVVVEIKLFVLIEFGQLLKITI